MSSKKSTSKRSKEMPVRAFVDSWINDGEAKTFKEFAEAIIEIDGEKPYPVAYLNEWNPVNLLNDLRTLALVEWAIQHQQSIMDDTGTNDKASKKS